MMNASGDSTSFALENDIGAAFSDDYFAARERFVAAARGAGARLVSLPCPANGPGGEPLFVDAAWHGAPDAAKLVVVSSGVHGIEGFAGSAIQIDALRHRVPPPGVALLHIHGVNPYGMAWTCLENEAGVDLNRNFIGYGGALPGNPLYDELDEIVMCPELSGPLRDKADLARDAYIARHGIEQFICAIANGQHHRPGRFNFGGDAPAWSNTAVRSLVDDLARDAREIAWVDVHTGLGDRGAGVMLVIEPTESADMRARQWWDSIILVPSSEFPFAPQGTLVAATYGMAPWANVTAAALEFGTDPVERVGQSMIDRFWLTSFSSTAAAEAPSILAEITDCLAPADTTWRRAVLRRGRVVLDQTLAGLAVRD